MKKPKWLRYIGFTSFWLLVAAAAAKLASPDVGNALFMFGVVIGVCWLLGSWMWSVYGPRGDQQPSEIAMEEDIEKLLRKAKSSERRFKVYNAIVWACSILTMLLVAFYVLGLILGWGKG